MSLQMEFSAAYQGHSKAFSASLGDPQLCPALHPSLSLPPVQPEVMSHSKAARCPRHTSSCCCCTGTVRMRREKTAFSVCIPRFVPCPLHKGMRDNGWSKEAHILCKMGCLKVPEVNCFKSRYSTPKMKLQRDTQCCKRAVQVEHRKDVVKSTFQGCCAKEM